MQYTKNLRLKKPEGFDEYDIKNENDNMDILDAAFNQGDIVKLETLSDLPERTEGNRNRLFYCKDVERYFYLRSLDGEYANENKNVKRLDAFDKDCTTEIQMITTVNKFYIVSLNYQSIDSILLEGVDAPPERDVYPDGTFVMCYKNSIRKLYKADTNAESGYIEVTNFKFAQYYMPYYYQVENKTYYY